jgi:hypothetical protein
VGGVESADATALAASAAIGAAMAAIESADSATVAGSMMVAATIVAVESPDASTAAASVTVGLTVTAAESADAVAISGQGVAGAASIAALEGGDATAVVAAVDAAGPVPGGGFVGGFGQPIYRKRPGQQPVAAPTRASVACVEGVDGCSLRAGDGWAPTESIAGLIEAAAYQEFRRKLEIERDDIELLLEL